MSPTFSVSYSAKALGFIAGLPKKIGRQVTEKCERLANDPRPAGCKLVHNMKDGEDPVYRIRSGDYRVLYVTREPVVLILDIDHRKDIYR